MRRSVSNGNAFECFDVIYASKSNLKQTLYVVKTRQLMAKKP